MTDSWDPFQRELTLARDNLAEVTRLLHQANAELRDWRTWGIIEAGVRNPNIASYMEHWEARAQKAEKELMESERQRFHLIHEVDRLRKQVSDQGWELSPDRMGG